MAASDDGKMSGHSTTARQSGVVLKNLVKEVRRTTGYYVASGWLSEWAQKTIGVATRKPTLSAYQESQILEEAVKLAGVTPVTWERTRGQYSSIVVDEQKAVTLQNVLEVGMRAYLEQRVKSTTFDAVKYAKERMAR